jgi:DNA-binding NarL/FixJ family response regulator
MAPTLRQPVRILLVDDDPVFRELLAFVLRSDLGAEIVGMAGDGARGVELAVELRPDVVVMDLRMPLMDGFDATRSIVSAVDGAHVLVVSSSTDSMDVERAKRAGAAGYVPKELAVADLSGEIERLRPAGRASNESGQLRLRRAALTRLDVLRRRLVLG